VNSGYLGKAAEDKGDEEERDKRGESVTGKHILAHVNSIALSRQTCDQGPGASSSPPVMPLAPPSFVPPGLRVMAAKHTSSNVDSPC
jgi:hypothetical protein